MCAYAHLNLVYSLLLPCLLIRSLLVSNKKRMLSDIWMFGEVFGKFVSIVERKGTNWRLLESLQPGGKKDNRKDITTISTQILISSLVVDLQPTRLIQIKD